MELFSTSAGGADPIDASSAIRLGSNEFRHISDHVTDIDATLRAHSLEQHVYELEMTGYTIVEDALTPEAVSALQDILITLGGEDDGRPVDARGSTHQERTQEVVLLLSRGGTPFEELILHPATLPLVTYLLGQSCTISSVTGYIKGPGKATLGVHSDTAYVPDPAPPYAQVANVNYCLTDYTIAAGCLSVVPGSHRYGHRPRDGQGESEAVAVEAPAGAAIVFHGNTWHGALPRSSPGIRLTLSTLFCRMYMRPQERYDEILSEQVLARNPSRFRTLVGKDLPTGWRSIEEAEQILQIRKARSATFYRTRGTHA